MAFPPCLLPSLLLSSSSPLLLSSSPLLPSTLLSPSPPLLLPPLLLSASLLSSSLPFLLSYCSPPPSPRLLLSSSSLEKRSLSALAVPDSQILIWRVLLGDRIGADELLINISTNQLLAEGEEEGLVELEQRESFNETQEFSIGRKRNDSEGHTPNRTLGGQRIHRNNRTRSFHTYTSDTQADRQYLCGLIHPFHREVY